MSFTEGSSFLSPSGPVQTLDNYRRSPSATCRTSSSRSSWRCWPRSSTSCFGFPFAYILVRTVRYRDVVRALMVFPMFGALYVTFGISFDPAARRAARADLQALGISGTSLLFSLPSVVFAMSIFTFPFMVMSIGTALSNVDPTLEEAAACLGAGPFATFRRFLLPLDPGGHRGGLADGLRLEHRGVRRAAAARLASTSSARSPVTLYDRGVVQNDYGLRPRWASSCSPSRSS